MPRARSLFGMMWSVGLLASSSVAALSQPSVLVTTEKGAPYIPSSSVKTACPQKGAAPDTRQRIVDIAAIEWAAFGFPRLSLTQTGFPVIPAALSPKISETSGKGTSPGLISIGAMEDDASVRARIGAYWAAVPDAYADVIARQNELWFASEGRAGWAEYWSGAFMSYVMCEVGLTSAQFARAASHREYIEAAIRARKISDKTYVYHAYNLAELLPSPGDIICAAREEAADSINSLEDFEASSYGAYHCDIVVGYDTDTSRQVPGLDAIGGNVLNAVTLTETPVYRGTRLKPLKKPHARNWFAILRYMGESRPASFRKVPKEVLEEAIKVRARRNVDK
jgi:hypothetical protein